MTESRCKVFVGAGIAWLPKGMAFNPCHVVVDIAPTAAAQFLPAPCLSAEQLQPSCPWTRLPDGPAHFLRHLPGLSRPLGRQSRASSSSQVLPSPRCMVCSATAACPHPWAADAY